MEAEIYNDDEEYPTSRVIKRAPNGDVVVEALSPQQTDADLQRRRKSSKSSGNGNGNNSGSKQRSKKPSIAATLDSHWESLSPEDKKRILRIEKDEVLEVIHRYQKDHSCSCSVCGRHHMAMDQEMERIYNMLYEIDKVKDPEINPVKFHLGIIKELQLSRSQKATALPGENMAPVHTGERLNSGEFNQEDTNNSNNNNEDGPSVRDDLVKNFLVADNVGSLKEELMHFKQSRQLRRTNEAGVDDPQQHQHQHQHQVLTAEDDNGNVLGPPVERHLEVSNGSQVNQTPTTEQPVVFSPEEAALREKYLNFTKRFVSSHPKIAQEYVNKMMLYPDMRAVTDDLMSDGGNSFLKAIESLMLQRPFTENQLGEQAEDATDNNSTTPYYANFGDARSFTTMLHNGKPLTAEEYAEMQRHIAERMTNSYDAKSKTFKEVSPLEKELFTRFMFGEERQQFAEVLMQSFRNKFDTEFGGSSMSASLAAAAAAATLTNPLSTTDATRSPFVYQGEARQEGNNDQSGEGEEQYFNQESEDDYSDSYNYSDYDGDSELASDYVDESDIMSEYNDVEDRFSHQQHSHHQHRHLPPPSPSSPSSPPPPPHHQYVHHTDNSNNYSNINNNNINNTMDTLHHPNYAQIDAEHIQDGLLHADQLHQRQHAPSYDEKKNEYPESEKTQDSYYEGEVDETDRLEEGRKLLQIAITKLLQSRIMESYNEKQADDNRMKLLQELEDEQQRKKEKEEKKQRKKEKEKEKRRLQQLAREEEKRKKAEEEEKLRLEMEKREMERREAQRKKVEEAKRRKDEERRRKLEEQRKREEYEEQQRKLKVEQKRKREEERKQRELENRKRREEEENKRKEAKRLKELEEQKKMQAEVEKEKAQKRSSRAAESGKVKTGPNNAPSATVGTRFTNKKRRESLVNSKVTPKQIYVKQPSDTELSKSLSDDIAGMISAATASQSSTMSPVHLQALLNPVSNVTKTSAVSPNPMQGTSSSFVSNTPSVFSSDKLVSSPNVLHTSTASNSFVNDKILSSLSGQTSPFVDRSHSAHRDPVWGPLSSSTYSSNSIDTSSGMLASSSGTSNLIGSNNTSSTFQHDGLSYLPSLSFLLPNSDSQKKPFGEELNSLTSMLSNSSLNDTSFATNTAKYLWGEPKTSMPTHMATTDIGAGTLGNLGLPLSSTAASAAVDTAVQKSSIWNNTPTTTLLSNFGTATTNINATTTNTNTNTNTSTATHSVNLAPRSSSSMDSSNYLSSDIWSHPETFSIHFDRSSGDMQAASSYASNTAGTTMSSSPDSSLSRIIYEVYLSLVGQDHSGQFIPADLLYQALASRGIDYTTFFHEIVQMQKRQSCEIATNSVGTLSHVKIVRHQQQQQLQSGLQQVHPSISSGASIQQTTQYLQPQTHQEQLYQSNMGRNTSNLMSSLFPNAGSLQETVGTGQHQFQNSSLLLNVGLNHGSK